MDWSRPSQCIGQMSSCAVPVAPAPPALKDLPKVAGDLKSELEGFSSSKLKNAETQEKIVLPSAEDLAAEKTEKALIEGIAKFDPAKLKHTETQEKNPLPDKDVIEQEKAQSNLLSGIENFDSTKLKHAETQEKNPLPTKEVIDQEKSA
ncbi:thymosin beta isoform X11 [Dendroctonus ponderosae]|uniref:thymosin beta isoform X11 n=1 Tax=Dendroctonus ponderosae TaxID=77166 RepID=UPI002035BA0C|nr:thymosin beta isoform X11 [Dendroctonus ponderosae]